MSDRIDWQTLCKPTPIPRHAAPADLQKLRNTAPIPTNLGGIERQAFHETIGTVLGISFASVAIGVGRS